MGQVSKPWARIASMNWAQANAVDLCAQMRIPPLANRLTRNRLPQSTPPGDPPFKWRPPAKSSLIIDQRRDLSIILKGAFRDSTCTVKRLEHPLVVASPQIRPAHKDQQFWCRPGRWLGQTGLYQGRLLRRIDHMVDFPCLQIGRVRGPLRPRPCTLPSPTPEWDHRRIRGRCAANPRQREMLQNRLVEREPLNATSAQQA